MKIQNIMRIVITLIGIALADNNIHNQIENDHRIRNFAFIGPFPKDYNADSLIKTIKSNTFSLKNVKRWIDTQEGIARSAGQTERSRTTEMSQKKRDAAMRKRLDAQSYIRIIKYYIRTGDWIGMYWGEHEQNLTKWKVITAEYK